MFASIISNYLAKVSLYKQKQLCNSQEMVYAISDLDEVPHISPRVPLNYEFISNTLDLVKYSQNPEIKKYAHKFQYFLDHGGSLYLAFTEGDIAGYYWVVDLSKFKPYLFTKSQLFDGNVTTYFIFFCKTFETYRNLGIYSYMLTQICKDPRLYNGKIMISTDLANYASQRGIEKAGFRKLFALRYLNIGGLKLIERYRMIDEH